MVGFLHDGHEVGGTTYLSLPRDVERRVALLWRGGELGTFASHVVQAQYGKRYHAPMPPT